MRSPGKHLMRCAHMLQRKNCPHMREKFSVIKPLRNPVQPGSGDFNIEKDRKPGRWGAGVVDTTDTTIPPGFKKRSACSTVSPPTVSMIASTGCTDSPIFPALESRNLSAPRRRTYSASWGTRCGEHMDAGLDGELNRIRTHIAGGSQNEYRLPVHGARVLKQHLPGCDCDDGD